MSAEVTKLLGNNKKSVVMTKGRRDNKKREMQNIIDN